MATLIAANYQSQSSTAYGFMDTYVGKLKNSTLYTIKCRYKWNANGTASTHPYAFYLWRSTWTNSYVVSNVYSDYTTYVGTWTSPSDAASYNWNINSYANGNHNGGTPDGAILSVDWFELWEGDTREFSLTDAIALSGHTGINDFLTLQGTTEKPLKNPDYFSTSEQKNAVRSWMGYYYKTNTYDVTGSLSTTSVTAAANEITINYTIKDIWSNGKKTAKGSVTPTVESTLGDVSDITATNSSGSGTAKLSVPTRGTTTGDARTGTVTIKYGGTTKTLTFSQDANVITSYENPTFDMWYSSGAGNSGTPVSAGGGTSAAPTYTVSQKANYTSGAQGAITPSITSAKYSVSWKDTAASATVNESTGVVTFGSLGTTIQNSNTKAAIKLEVVSHGKTGSDEGWCYQAANTITSYGTPQASGIKWSSFVPASGGASAPTIGQVKQVVTYTSGSSQWENVTPSISYTRAQIVQNTDPEFYNGSNSIGLYDNASSGKTTLTRVSSGYPSGIPNNSGVAYRIQNTGSGPTPGLGGFYHAYQGSASQEYICTFDAYIPNGYYVEFASNNYGWDSGGTAYWLTGKDGCGEWRTYSYYVKGGSSFPSSTFFFYLVGTAGSSSSPVTWWVANTKICKISGISVANSTAPVVNTSNGTITLASRGTTTGSAGVVDTNAAWVATITANGKSTKVVGAPSQAANSVIKTDLKTAGSWSYNWTTTGNSTRTKTDVYTDTYTSNSTKDRDVSTSETGGTRYIVLDSFSDNKSEGSEHVFGAGGGTITARTVSHDYWPNTSGSHIQTVVITDVTVACDGFNPTVSGSTVTFTANSKGTNVSAANSTAIVSTKSGFQTRNYGSCKQEANAVTKIEAVVANTSTSSCHWYYSGGSSSSPIAASGGTVTVNVNGACKFTFTSGSTDTVGSSGTHYGNTLSFSRTYSGSATGFTLNTSNGSVTAANNTTTSSRSISVTSGLKVSWGSLENTLSQSRSVYQAKGTVNYQIVLDPSSITWAASGGSQAVSVKYNTLWNGIKTAGPTALSSYSVSCSNCSYSGTGGTTTITVAGNKSSQRNVSATFSKDGYTPATLTGTQNAAVTSTDTVYRVSSVTPSTVSVAATAGSGTLTVKMDKATITYYKNSSTSSAFESSLGSWSALTGKEAYAAMGNTRGTMFSMFVGTDNTSSNDFISYGSTTYSLTNYTSTSAATWSIPYNYTRNSNTTTRTTQMRAYRGSYDVSGQGSNYSQITQAAGSQQLEVSFWATNINQTDIYTSFSMGQIHVYYSGTSWCTAQNLAFGGSIPGYDREDVLSPIAGAGTYRVDLLSGYNSIPYVNITFDTANIENALDSSRYYGCQMWVEIDSSNGGSYSGSTYKSDNVETISTNYNPLVHKRLDFMFSFYNHSGYTSNGYWPGAPIDSNSRIKICFKFYDY